MKGDFALVDEIYHPDYKATDVTTCIENNLADDKAVVFLICRRSYNWTLQGVNKA